MVAPGFFINLAAKYPPSSCRTCSGIQEYIWIAKKLHFVSGLHGNDGIEVFNRRTNMDACQDGYCPFIAWK